MNCSLPPISELSSNQPGQLLDALRRALDSVSSQTGIIRRVYYEELYHDDPDFHWAVSEPSNLERIVGNPVANAGIATAATPERAAMKAIGESLERYCAAFYDENDLALARRSELPGPAADPTRFALFSPLQYSAGLKPIRSPSEAAENEPTGSKRFHYSPIGEQTTLRWAQARSMGSGEVIFVPAAFVFIPYQYDYPNEPIVSDLVSTGLACGSSFAEACYKGLMEVVERDAFMLTWHNRIPARRIALDRIASPGICDLLHRFRRIPARLEAFVLDVDLGIPVVMAVISGEQRPYHVVGAAADLSMERALQLAIEEVALSFCGLRRLCYANSDWAPEPDYSNVDDLNKHALVHAAAPELQRSLDFLREGKEIDLFAEINRGASWRDHLKHAVGLVSEAGYDVLAVDLTTPDVDQLGFKVIRAIVPGFQPLDVNHNHRHLGGARLQALSAGRQDGINPLPHPFP